ncbi:ATP-binding cassette domain-containing protein [Streptomyces xiangluensis]|uniref:ATP-binding cassette domain-containing protein n=1 Tax=Streptomyces xiangluensis TaxID=2665720 RepID=A0ABV8YPZ3_9ACTN
MPVSGEPSPVLTLDGVTVRRASTLLLHDVTCQVPAGACTVLVGPSGAGKSTLLRLLNRFEEPTAGAVTYRGRPLPAWDVLALRREVALVAQQPVLLADRLLDELRIGLPALAEADAGALLRRLGLPSGAADRATSSLSGGEAQRVCLARTLAVAPRVLLLDEPTSALDAYATKAVETVIGELVADGMSVVVVSHDTAQVRRIADHVLVLESGRLIDSGSADKISSLQEGV